MEVNDSLQSNEPRFIENFMFFYILDIGYCLLEIYNRYFIVQPTLDAAQQFIVDKTFIPEDLCHDCTLKGDCEESEK